MASEHFLGVSFKTQSGALMNLDRMRVFLWYIGDSGLQNRKAEDFGIQLNGDSK